MAFFFDKESTNLFILILCMLSYFKACEPHAVAFDKLLHALTVFDLSSWVLTRDGVADAP